MAEDVKRHRYMLKCLDKKCHNIMKSASNRELGGWKEVAKC